MLELSLNHLGLITKPEELSTVEQDRIVKGLAKIVLAVGNGAVPLLPFSAIVVLTLCRASEAVTAKLHFAGPESRHPRFGPSDCCR